MLHLGSFQFELETWLAFSTIRIVVARSKQYWRHNGRIYISHRERKSTRERETVVLWWLAIRWGQCYKGETRIWIN